MAFRGQQGLSIMVAHIGRVELPCPESTGSTDISLGLQMELCLLVDPVSLPRVSLILHQEDASFFKWPMGL